MRARSGNSRLRIGAAAVLDGLKLGDSVAVSGPCLTVVELGRNWFEVEAAGQTVNATTIGQWRRGRTLNLERALRLGDRLGGHLVQGHIDAVGMVARISYGAGSSEVHIESPAAASAHVIDKGSVAVDGVSLTIYKKTERGFSVMLIPHTLDNTALKNLKPGDAVNIETDIFIRWLAERTRGLFGDDAGARWDGGLGEFHRED